MREIKIGELTGEELKHAFREGIEWLNSLKQKQLEVCDPDVIVVVDDGLKGMSPVPEREEGIRFFSVELKFPGGDRQRYMIDSRSGLFQVEVFGRLKMDTEILGKLPVKGIVKSRDETEWRHTPIRDGELRLVYSDAGLVDDRGYEIGERKALKVISWLRENLV